MSLFREKIVLKLEKYDFKPGETIRGEVTLNLKKSIKARKLQISLIGQRKEMYRDEDGDYNYYYTEVFNFTQPLASEGTYLDEHFPFEIKIPSNIMEQVNPHLPEYDGALGKIAKFSAALSGHGYFPVEWFVKAHLDVPLKIDVKKIQKIIISE